MRENLKAFRENIGFTQEQMASRLGCTRQFYTAVETGTKNGTLERFWTNLQIKFQIKDSDMWKLTNITRK